MLTEKETPFIRQLIWYIPGHEPLWVWLFVQVLPWCKCQGSVSSQKLFPALPVVLLWRLSCCDAAFFLKANLVQNQCQSLHQTEVLMLKKKKKRQILALVKEKEQQNIESITSFHMKAALDQRTLTNTESEPEKSHHIQHHHYPGRGYQLLQSTVSREINVETPSVLQEIVRSQDRPQQHCLFALAIEWAPATAEPRALTVKAAEPLQYPTTLTFSSKW